KFYTVDSSFNSRSSNSTPRIEVSTYDRHILHRGLKFQLMIVIFYTEDSIFNSWSSYSTLWIQVSTHNPQILHRRFNF
ncbi:MAG: hypothetical protein ACOH2V_09685, partial [Candidatus Saccharimonadaceae bacterium]